MTTEVSTAEEMSPTIRISTSNGAADASTVSTPVSRRFREAWQLEGDVIVVDMERAKEIHRENLRAARKPHFQIYDDIIRPLDRKRVYSALTAAEVEVYKTAEEMCQKLRDVTIDPRIDAAATPDELAALTLDALVPDV